MSILKKARLINEAAERERESFAASAKKVIDATFEALFEAAKENNIKFIGDDRAARVEEALAEALISCDDGLAWNVRLEEQRQVVEDIEGNPPKVGEPA
jgi:hypothetical protein